MPIYDYVCAACGHRAEILHGVHDSGPNFCPECGAEGTMRKAIAAPTFHFKGSGWAKKDRAAGSRTKAAANADADPSTDKAATDKVPDKPAPPGDKPAPPADKPAAPAAPADPD
jgi:putative FmdB family regulatory protein